MKKYRIRIEINPNEFEVNAKNGEDAISKFWEALEGEKVHILTDRINIFNVEENE